MDFKIDKGRGTIGGRGDGQSLITARTALTSDDGKAELTKARQSADKEELASYGEEQAATGDSLVIGNIKNALGAVNDALDEVLYLKTQELNIARRAAALPEVSAQHSQLYAEMLSYAEPIDLALNATSNGMAVTNGGTYTISASEGEIRNAISTGQIARNYPARYDVSNATEGSASAEELEAQFISYRANKAAYGAAAAKADHLVPKPKEEVFTVKETRPNTLESVEEAQRLATNIANKLGAAYGNEQTVSKLIESSTQGLDLDRVKGLLS